MCNCEGGKVSFLHFWNCLGIQGVQRPVPGASCFSHVTCTPEPGHEAQSDEAIDRKVHPPAYVLTELSFILLLQFRRISLRQQNPISSLDPPLKCHLMPLSCLFSMLYMCSSGITHSNASIIQPGPLHIHWEAPLSHVQNNWQSLAVRVRDSQMFKQQFHLVKGSVSTSTLPKQTIRSPSQAYLNKDHRHKKEWVAKIILLRTLHMSVLYLGYPCVMFNWMLWLVR